MVVHSKNMGGSSWQLHEGSTPLWATCENFVLLKLLAQTISLQTCVQLWSPQTCSPQTHSALTFAFAKLKSVLLKITLGSALLELTLHRFILLKIALLIHAHLKSAKHKTCATLNILYSQTKPMLIHYDTCKILFSNFIST